MANDIPCIYCKKPRGSNTKCLGCNFWRDDQDKYNQHECQKCKKFVKHSDFHGPYLSFTFTGVCWLCYKELEDEESEKEAERERLKKEAKEQTEKERSKKEQEKKNKQNDPKEPEKKCEFCHRNNIEVKLTIEGKENLVCQSCYKSYKAKSEEDKDYKDDGKDDKTQKEQDYSRERERERAFCSICGKNPVLEGYDRCSICLETNGSVCSDCKQKKDNLLDYQNNNKTIKICADCEQKRDNNKPEIPRKDNKPNPEDTKKWGSDFKQLKPVQQEGRVATDNSWKKSCQNKHSRTSLLCPYCREKFNYDKSIEDYLSAKREVERRLTTHKSSCPLKSNKSEQKKRVREEWDEFREKVKKTNKGRIYYECKKCWGKIIRDINITDAELARKQNRADLKQHEKECHKSAEERMIAVYHSPNKGGNKHANINDFTYDDMDDIPLKTDEEKQEYQEQNPSQIPNNKDKGLSGGVIALMIGGVIIVFGMMIAGAVSLVRRRPKQIVSKAKSKKKNF